MKPTPAEIENGIPRSASARTPPDDRERDARVDQERLPDRAERGEEQDEDQEERERHDEQQPRRRALEVLELSRPTSGSSRAEVCTSLAIAACASLTKLPMSRPRTFSSTPMRRRVSSREICAGPSTSAMSASCASGMRAPFGAGDRQGS